jgi:ribosomal protein S1
VLEIDPRKKQIKLSIKAVEQDVETEEEPEAPVLTPMEMAFRQAQSRGRKAQKHAPQRKGDSSRATGSRDEQEDIFKRTIQQHVPKA